MWKAEQYFRQDSLNLALNGDKLTAALLTSLIIMVQQRREILQNIMQVFAI